MLALSTTVGAQTSPVTITLWHIAAEGDPFRPVLQRAIDEFNAAHPDLQFEARAIPNEEFKVQLQDAIAANREPDVFQTWGGGLLQTYVDMGVVRDIPELNGEVERRFVPEALTFSTFDGKRYAVPANIAGIFLWYNQDLFSRHQVEMPTTWDHLIQACHAFRQQGITPVGLGNKDRWPGAFWLMYLAMRTGGSEVLINDVNQVNSAFFTHPAFIEAGRRIQEAVNAGCFERAITARTLAMPSGFSLRARLPCSFRGIGIWAV
jgi:raffinose/stachyose/melibiose transport system substrate-binding protein